MSGRPAALPILLPFAIVTLIWGSTWIVIHDQLGVVPAQWSVAYRFLVAGVAMDQLGPRRVVPFGAAAVAIGALLFASGNPTLAGAGRLLQGAGGVFALVGAAYIATTNFPASRAARGS